MSRFFKQTQNANGGAKEQAHRDTQVLDLEKLLEAINQTVEDQFSGIEEAPRPQRVEAALDVAKAAPASVACEVVEFPTERFRQIRISRNEERVFFPERETGLAPPALEAYRSFRTRLLRLQAKRQFRTIAISSSTKGEGKSLTSLNMGMCCAQLPQFPVLIIDGDLRTRGVTRLVGHDHGPGLAEVLEGSVTRESVVLATDIPNLHIMPSGNAVKPAPELLSGAPLKQLLAWCRENFKLVLVDCPPALPLADFDLISSSCDAILLIARARNTDREALQKVLAHVDHGKLLGVTLNSVARSDHKPYEYYYYGPSRSESRSR